MWDLPLEVVDVDGISSIQRVSRHASMTSGVP